MTPAFPFCFHPRTLLLAFFVDSSTLLVVLSLFAASGHRQVRPFFTNSLVLTSFCQYLRSKQYPTQYTVRTFWTAIKFADRNCGRPSIPPMRSSFCSVACLATLFSSSLALEFTSPSSDSQIDPSKSVVISWSVSYTDPSTIDLKLSNSDLGTDLTIATGVVSYTGSYTVPAGTIQGSGSGYEIVAVGNGDNLAQITGLTFGSKGGNGPVTLVTTATVIPTPAASTTSGGHDGTDSNVPTATINSVGVITLSGTVTGSKATTSATNSRTESSFATSTTSRASSESNGAVAPSAGSTNTANGQKRRGGELVLGAAGLLAGVVALLA
ncbi:hypothetical protein AYL99_07292 [Fonsecaea erecta]|uniref:Yeast cell wall synthesis Kre9/Knh1-like N-terminal domain-containing protein n=1 Tax=Fonsecaea erecta TaxID=1367422 RepID=A0A178ZEY7_9EURO|nr:hypothetical protein AYL99_07292 [Fonsecaea erecta]OAP58202.1 hypothetical protein AYL99_07292 [Fonsecaea erecta]